MAKQQFDDRRSDEPVRSDQGLDPQDREDKAHAAPWVAAEEMQPPQRPQSCCPLDDVDEALLESFPCSDPPCYSHAHA